MLVELDGERWRTIPLDVAARVGLAPGIALDRGRARALRRELRRNEALTTAVRALSRRERSEDGLRRVLERKGVAAEAQEEAVATLRAAGAVDDARFASLRATALAERGLGDLAITFALEREGIAAELLEEAVATLEPERERAVRLAAGREPAARTARWLARRGFALESIEAAVPAVAGDAATELG